MATSATPQPAPGAPVVADPAKSAEPVATEEASSGPAKTEEKTTDTEAPKSEETPYPPEPLLVLDQIIIRPWHLRDAPQIAALANNKNISVNMTNRFPSPYLESSAEEFIKLSLNPKESKVYAYGITLHPSEDGTPGPVIGSIGFDPGPDVFAHNAELGYWIGEPYWGKGYAKAACRAMTDHAFGLEDGVVEGKKLQRLGAGVFGGNPGSGKVLRSCGYKHEGTMRGIVLKWGVVRDLETWGQPRGDWEEDMKRRNAS